MEWYGVLGFEHVYVKEHFIDWALEQQIGLHCLV